MHDGIPELVPLPMPFALPRTAQFYAVTTRDRWPDALLDMPLPIALQRANKDRQKEFVVGRLCARMALFRLGHENSEAPVGVGAHREPLWPESVVGSITHTARFACALVAWRDDWSGVGVDAENIIQDPERDGLLERVASTDEVVLTLAHTGGDLAKAATLLFSAKEAVFKAYFPRTGLFLDFVDVVIDDLAGDGSFTARVKGAESTERDPGRHYRGLYSLGDAYVTTAVFASAA